MSQEQSRRDKMTGIAIASEMELPLLPVESPELSANPYPYFDAARRQHPWLARFAEGYIVHDYRGVAELLGEDDNLLPGFGPVVDFYDVHDTMWARFWADMLPSISGEKHKRLRASVAHAFTPRHANHVRPLMQKVIGELLDEWTPKGEFDFIEFASFFPISVMCGLLGVSTEPIPRIRSALETHIMSLSLDPALREPALAGWDVMWRFADETVKQREASGEFDEESLLDQLIASRNAGGMDEIELRFMLLVLVLAGFDTSRNMLGLIMKTLLERPEMYARCAEDKAFCGKVVEEALRIFGIATPYRVVGRDFVYRNVAFRKGEVIVCITALAGHDATVFDDPATFDPARMNANRNVAFGRGAHICLGQFLARTQLQEGLHLIAQRLRHPRLAGAIGWKPFIGAWGLTQLPIAFEPQGRPQTNS
jgi:cytochrome P450